MKLLTNPQQDKAINAPTLIKDRFFDQSINQSTAE